MRGSRRKEKKRGGRVLHVDGTCNWKAPFPYLLIVIVLI